MKLESDLLKIYDCAYFYWENDDVKGIYVH